MISDSNKLEEIKNLCISVYVCARDECKYIKNI